MNILTKALVSIGVIFLFGIIITVLYEQGGVAPGDGLIGFILFGGLITIIVLIWKSKSNKP